MTASVKSKRGTRGGDEKEQRKGGTRVNTVIYVRGTAKKTAKKKASVTTGSKGAKKAAKKPAAARPRRDRVRDGK